MTKRGHTDSPWSRAPCSGSPAQAISTEANSAAWHQGKRLLERAIAERLDFAVETTLGGRAISALLQQAVAAGIEVRVWFVGLSSPALHIARVRARVARGRTPQPTLILHLVQRRIVQMVQLPKTPQWARPIVAAAITLST